MTERDLWAQEAKLSVDVGCYVLGEVDLRVQVRDWTAPDACSYADPVYWAGFQINCW